MSGPPRGILGSVQRRRSFCRCVAAGALLAACKPATEEDEYRRALKWTDVDDVRAQLDAGKDPNHAFDDGDKPIHVIVSSATGEPEVLKLLLERGAKVDATDGDGKTAWDRCWGDGRGKLREKDALMLIALLDAGFVPPADATFEDDRTLLHEVARRAPSSRLVGLLVDEHGATIDARDAYGWTPLHVAVHENNTEAASGLLQKGADANAETTTTKQETRPRGETTIVQWRYEAGSRPLDVARPNARGRFDEDVRKVLAEYGATSNDAVDNESR